jgi:hypothetical protein
MSNNKKNYKHTAVTNIHFLLLALCCTKKIGEKNELNVSSSSEGFAERIENSL